MCDCFLYFDSGAFLGLMPALDVFDIQGSECRVLVAWLVVQFRVLESVRDIR